MIGPFDHSEFDSILLANDPLYLVTTRNKPLARRHEVRPAYLGDCDLILGDVIEGEAYGWRLDDLFSSEGLPPNLKLEASNTLALIGLVSAGLGVTIHPESLVGFLGNQDEVRPIMHTASRPCWFGCGRTALQCSRASWTWRRNFPPGRRLAAPSFLRDIEASEQ